MAKSKNATTVTATVVDTLLGNKAFKGTLSDKQKINFMFNAKGEGIPLLHLVQENGRFQIKKGATPNEDQDFAIWLECAKLHYKEQLSENATYSSIVGIDQIIRVLGYSCGMNYNSNNAAYATATVNAVNAAKVVLRNIRANDSAQISVDTKLSKVNAMAQQKEFSAHRVVANDLAAAMWDMPTSVKGKISGIAYERVVTTDEDGTSRASISFQYRAKGKTKIHKDLVFTTRSQLVSYINTRLTRDQYDVPASTVKPVEPKKLDIQAEVKARQSSRRNPQNRKKTETVAVAA